MERFRQRSRGRASRVKQFSPCRHEGAGPAQRECFRMGPRCQWQARHRHRTHRKLPSPPTGNVPRRNSRPMIVATAACPMRASNGGNVLGIPALGDDGARQREAGSICGDPVEQFRTALRAPSLPVGPARKRQRSGLFGGALVAPDRRARRLHHGASDTLPQSTHASGSKPVSPNFGTAICRIGEFRILRCRAALIGRIDQPFSQPDASSKRLDRLNGD